MVCNYPIDVISLCSVDGGIQPLRFRLKDDSQQLVRVDILEVVDVKVIPIVGIEAQIFLCRCKAGETCHMFELKYTIRSHCWCLYRIVC